MSRVWLANSYTAHFNTLILYKIDNNLIVFTDFPFIKSFSCGEKF